MKLYTFKGKYQIQRMEEERLIPTYSLNRQHNEIDFKIDYFITQIFGLFSPSIKGSLPKDSSRKGIFAFLPGFENSKWTKKNVFGRTHLGGTLESIMQSDKEIYLLTWNMEPQDHISVFEFDYFFKSHPTCPEITNYNLVRRYFESETPLFYYDGNFLLPEAVCFTPISRNRISIELKLDTFQDIESIVGQIRNEVNF